MQIVAVAVQGIVLQACTSAARVALCRCSGLKGVHRAYIKVTTLFPHRTGAPVRVTAQKAHLRILKHTLKTLHVGRVQ